jgi:hypothetical protein
MTATLRPEKPMYVAFADKTLDFGARSMPVRVRGLGCERRYLGKEHVPISTNVVCYQYTYNLVVTYRPSNTTHFESRPPAPKTEALRARATGTLAEYFRVIEKTSIHSFLITHAVDYCSCSDIPQNVWNPDSTPRN